MTGALSAPRCVLTLPYPFIDVKFLASQGFCAMGVGRGMLFTPLGHKT
jgi:hypothetical protein